MGRRVSSLGGWAIAVAGLMPALCFGQATSNAQTFVLSDTKDLVLLNVKADAIEYQGRQAVRLTKETEKDGFALLRGTDLQDGAIEADIALKITTPPGVRMPGFVGIAFRARPDASRYELFCLRPGTRAPMTRRCGTMRVMRRIACPSFGHRFGRPSDSEPRCAPRPHSTSVMVSTIHWSVGMASIHAIPL